MAVIIELTDQQRRDLVKMLNNLNLSFVYSGFGEAFAGMIDGNPLTMEPDQKDELKHLINNLNIATWHGKTGDLLVDLMGAQSGPGAATAMTEAQVEMVANHLEHLNIGLSKLGIGHMVKATVAAYVASAGASTGGNTGTGSGTNPVTPPPAAKAISAMPDQATAEAGDVIAFAKMFTATNVTPAELDFTVSPAAGKKGGAVDAKGDLTLDDDATGKVTVTAKAKTGVTVAGSPATFTITAVTVP